MSTSRIKKDSELMLKFIESNFNEQNDININNSINKININNEEENNNKNFQKLKEIEKDYPMEAHQPFEIKENIIGVYWNFDDAENDETISDNEEAEINHLNDGLYIYEIKNDEIQEIKMIKKDPYHYHSFIYLKDSIIIDYFEGFKRKVFTLDKNNLQIINNLTFIDDNSLFWNMSAFIVHILL